MITSIILTIARGLIRFAGVAVDARTEQLRIKAGVDIAAITAEMHANRYARDVMLAAMNHRIFWVVWGLFAVPLATWWAWGMGNTIFVGVFPHVAEIPETMRPYADAIVANVFYTGGGMAIASSIVRAWLGRRP